MLIVVVVFAEKGEDVLDAASQNFTIHVQYIEPKMHFDVAVKTILAAFSSIFNC